MTEPARGETGAVETRAGTLGAAEFSSMFQSIRHRLWLIAAAVLCDRAEADDIVQEAALVGLKKRGEFAEGTQFDAWMGQITRNLALNARRTRRRRADSRERFAQHDGTRRPVASDERERVPEGALLAGLEQLEEVPRICLLLRVVGEAPYAVIARTLGIPEGTAQSHVHRARRRLRDTIVGAQEGEA